ncbi:hypothetical protein CRG98_010462 [Punica granatum]|uniref:Uncharacterized protein n=1 Tax=Punica granatum TaxID=22663 RepID=A0A2I0KKW2_PUNGR|nr:hypothetical protein CRG98_010462 [Punica granatum]
MACMFGELGARGVRLECTGGAMEAPSARAGSRGARACAGNRRAQQRGRGSARLCGYGCTVHLRARPSPKIT